MLNARKRSGLVPTALEQAAAAALVDAKDTPLAGGGRTPPGGGLTPPGGPRDGPPDKPKKNDCGCCASLLCPNKTSDPEKCPGLNFSLKVPDIDKAKGASATKVKHIHSTRAMVAQLRKTQPNLRSVKDKFVPLMPIDAAKKIYEAKATGVGAPLVGGSAELLGLAGCDAAFWEQCEQFDEAQLFALDGRARAAIETQLGSLSENRLVEPPTQTQRDSLQQAAADIAKDMAQPLAALDTDGGLSTAKKGADPLVLLDGSSNIADAVATSPSLAALLSASGANTAAAPFAMGASPFDQAAAPTSAYLDSKYPLVADVPPLVAPTAPPAAGLQTGEPPGTESEQLLLDSIKAKQRELTDMLELARVRRGCRR